MRLISLYIEDYKNIKKQTFDFSANTGFIALIGLNGSGKSNLLEAIGLIFNGLFNNKRIPFAYEIAYEHDGKTYLRKPRISMIDGTKVKDSDMFYPSSVIACYSGEDLRLWHMAFEDYYMHYFKQAINNSLFLPQLIYINKYCWNIALLSLLCSEKDNVKRFLKETFNIGNLDTVKVKFSFGNPDSFKNHLALSWIKRIREECLDKDGQASIKSILSYEIPPIVKQTKEKSLFHHLYLLSQPKKNRAKGNNIERYVKEINIENDGISFDNYSEGHKKLILIECITQVLGDDASFILLDEPDAHVHIENKKKILDTITQFNGQTVLTTHSPVMCNLITEAKNIKLLKDGESVDTSKLEQLKKLSGNELQYYEGAFVLSSKKILVTEGIYDIRYLRKAIEVFEKKDPKYGKLKEVGMLYAGSASEEDVIYNELIQDKIANLDKVVFLFDYDKAGLDGWKKVNPIATAEHKVVPIFYQLNYGISLDTTTNNVLQQDSIQVEDLFAPTAYASLFTNPSIMEATYKYFRCRQKITDNIKKFLQDNYSIIADVHYNNYEPLLNKLLSIYFGI